MRKLYVLISLSFVLLIFTVYQKVNTGIFTNKDIEITETSSEEQSLNIFLEQKNETGQVTVFVQPIAVFDSDTWDFKITLQTHNVELSMDILESIVLIDSNGSEVKPFEWNGDAPGGHHRAGILRFAVTNLIFDNIVLRAKDIAEVEVREFEWKL